MENSTLFTGCCFTCFAFYLRLNRLISSFKVKRETLPSRQLVVLFHSTQVFSNLNNLIAVVDKRCTHLHADSVAQEPLRHVVVFDHCPRSKHGSVTYITGFNFIEPFLNITDSVFRRYHDPAVDEVQILSFPKRNDFNNCHRYMSSFSNVKLFI